MSEPWQTSHALTFIYPFPQTVFSCQYARYAVQFPSEVHLALSHIPKGQPHPKVPLNVIQSRILYSSSAISCILLINKSCMTGSIDSSRKRRPLYHRTQSFTPSISVLIPSPFLTVPNAFSASSNETFPVINPLTSTLPLATSSTATR